MAGSYEHDTGPSFFYVMYVEFIDCLRNGQLFRKNFSFCLRTLTQVVPLVSGRLKALTARVTRCLQRRGCEPLCSPYHDDANLAFPQSFHSSAFRSEAISDLQAIDTNVTISTGTYK